MEDDFEYYITFPTFAETITKKEHVIILFGWAGCIDKYLAKYSDIYKGKECTTIRYIASPNIVSPRCIDEKKLHYLAEKVVALLLDMRFHDYPIFFHMFSNGGATVYRYVAEEIKKHPNTFKVRGCIFDSCPARVRPAGFLRAALATSSGSPLRRWATALFALARVLLVGLYSRVLAFVTGRPNYFRLYDALMQEEPHSPQLFVFSKADDVCPWDTIRDFAEGRRRRGVAVTELLFEDSPHVKHLLSHRKEYEGAVHRFVDENLGE